MWDKQVGSRIRELRERNHYTREKFAEKINISPKFLYEIETGKKRFSIDILADISKVLEVSCDYLVFGEDSEHYGIEKIRCLLETMDSAQRSEMQSLLQAVECFQQRQGVK